MLIGKIVFEKNVVDGYDIRSAVKNDAGIKDPSPSVVLSLSEDVVITFKASKLSKNDKGELIEEKEDIDEGEEPKPLLISDGQLNPEASFGLKFFEVLKKSKIIVSLAVLSDVLLLQGVLCCVFTIN
jgi:hypothetical protein